MAEPGPPVAVTTNSDQGTKSAWRRPAGGPTARAASPRRRDDYRFELGLLAATALVWMVTGAVLWWRGASVPGRAEIAADLQTARTADSPWRAAASEAPADLPHGAESTSGPFLRDAVDPTIEDLDDEDDDASDDDSSNDDARTVATTAQNPHDAATASQLLAAESAASPPTAMGSEALARPPPGAAIEPAAVPSDAASGRLYLQGPASFGPAIAPAESLPPPDRAAAPVAGRVHTPTQTKRPVAASSQAPGAHSYSRGAAFDAAAARGAGQGALRPATATVQPIAVASDPQLDRLLAEAWGLIERGDHGPGRSRLLQARRLAGDDPRADFSLGLLDGLLENDWNAAEKRFADCVRRIPANVPSLNNLAIAEAMNRHEAQAARRWRSIVEQNAATPEVAQSIGYARSLMQDGTLRANRALLKVFDDVYTEAAVATLYSARPEGGFQFIPLLLSDGRAIGWNDLRKMEYAAPPPATLPVDNHPTPLGRPQNAALGASVPEVPPAMFPWRGLPQNPPVISREPTTPYPRRNRTRR